MDGWMDGWMDRSIDRSIDRERETCRDAEISRYSLRYDGKTKKLFLSMASSGPGPRW